MRKISWHRLYVTVVNLTGPLETFHALFCVIACTNTFSWFIKNPVSIYSRRLRDTWLLVCLFRRAFGFFVSCIVREKRLFNTESERSLRSKSHCKDRLFLVLIPVACQNVSSLCEWKLCMRGNCDRRSTGAHVCEWIKVVFTLGC